MLWVLIRSCLQRPQYIISKALVIRTHVLWRTDKIVFQLSLICNLSVLLMYKDINFKAELKKNLAVFEVTFLKSPNDVPLPYIIFSLIFWFSNHDSVQHVIFKKMH